MALDFRCFGGLSAEVGGASEHHAANALWGPFHESQFCASRIHLVEDHLTLPPWI